MLTLIDESVPQVIDHCKETGHTGISCARAHGHTNFQKGAR